MHTLSFQAPEELVQKLALYSDKLDRSKSYLIRSALEEYLEDMEDLLEAKRIQASYGTEELIPFEDIKRQHQLD